MDSWNPPTSAELARLDALAARPENRAYFFDRLQNPEWVSALSDRGSFGAPPPPMPADQPGHVWFPPWPEGRYLARMAPSASAAVARVLSEHSRSDNPAVTRLALEAFGALPDEEILTLAPKALEWIKRPDDCAGSVADRAEHFADEATLAIRRMLEVGATKRGLTAVSVLLKPAPIANSRSRYQVESRLSEWKYGRVLKSLLPVLVDLAGLEGVRTLSWLLMDAIRGTRGSQEAGESEDEYSFIWRPAIENHGQNTDDGVRGALISAVRDAALRFSQFGELQIQQIVEELDARSFVHRRISLHVLASSSGAIPLVLERLTDRLLFDDHRVRHEYASLLRARFGDLPSEAQEIYLERIAQGPDLDALRQPRLGGYIPTEEDVARWAEHWQRDRLSFVAPHLCGDHSAQYCDLVARLGEPEHPDFSTWSSGAATIEYPPGGDEIAGRSPDEVIRHLQPHQPGEDSDTNRAMRIEGLRGAFQSVVKDRAEEFALLSGEVSLLAPAYVSSFIRGLEEAVTAGSTFSWEEPLRLADVVVSYPFATGSDGDSQNSDYDWRWARQAVASLLRVGFTDRENRVPFVLRELAWRVLERLTHDPHDSNIGEVISDGKQLDVFTQSINTNRGLAMHAVVEYMLWCRRELEASGADISQGLCLIPEGRDVLDRHLDPNHDRSPVVRAVYGNSIPWLVLLDKSWVTSRLTRIFPTEQEFAALRNAAWTTYLSWCPPYDSVYEVLWAEYAAAVERVPADDFGGGPEQDSADVKLGQHLVTFYWRGVVPASLIETYFGRADDALAGSIMEFVGKTLENTGDSIPEDVLQRIQDLWDSRLLAIEAARQSEGAELCHREAQAFGVTFASGKLSEDWVLPSLERALGIGGAGWYGLRVVERLASLALTRPVSATRLTLELLSNTTNAWDHHSFEDSVRSMLEITGEVPDQATRENRLAIIDHYVTRGQHAFRELV